MNKSKLSFKEGLLDGLPIGLGYLSVSFAFGVSASALGIPYYISLLISMTNLTSAGQVAGVTVIATAGTIIELLLTQLVINARYFLMSISLSQKLDDTFSPKFRLLCSAGVTDEIFAVASSKPALLNKTYFLGLLLLPYVGWASGTFLGTLVGDILPTIISSALSIALYAMFIAIIIPPSLKNRGVCLAVILGAGLSCAFYYIPLLHDNVSSGFVYIICALVASIICAVLFPVEKKESGV